MQLGMTMSEMSIALNKLGEYGEGIESSSDTESTGETGDWLFTIKM